MRNSTAVQMRQCHSMSLGARIESAWSSRALGHLRVARDAHRRKVELLRVHVGVLHISAASVSVCTIWQRRYAF